MSKTQTVQNAGTAPASLNDGPLDVFKYRWLFLGISLLFLLPGIFFIVQNTLNPEIQAPVRLGIDFRGGTILEYGFSKPVVQADVNDIRAVFDKDGYTGTVIQIQEPRVGINKHAVEIGGSSKPAKSEPGAAQPVSPKASELPSAQGSLQTPAPASPKVPDAATPAKQEAASTPSSEKAAPVSEKPASESATPAAEKSTAVATASEGAENGRIATIVSIRSKQLQGQDELTIRKELSDRYGKITLLQKNSIGPALAKELLTNGLLALLMAYLLIVGYLTFRFQFDFAVCAMAALVHDTIFLIGMFALFGALFHTEVDSLFITAVLTVVGFSVHDTIVVFDRIRENNRIYFTKKVPFVKIVNMSINQTMARSINTSLTALLTMLALYFFGGETTKDFVLAIIIGIAAGTYSSVFNASVLLAMWRNRNTIAPAVTPATA
jgi:preprotein translocase subunit SecF